MRSKLIQLLSLLVCISLLSIASGKSYGKKITLKEKTKISEILANPDKFNEKKVLVEGAVVDVCKERGCWIKIGSDKEFESIRFKVEDGVIVFPLDLKGKNVVAEGIVSVKNYSKEQLIEQGKEKAKEEGTEFDPSTITGPKTIIQIKGEGAKVQ